jgi:hypothetical protein
VPPQKQTLDTGKIKKLMVVAASAATELRLLTSEENVDHKTMVVAKLSVALFDGVEAVIEAGILPLSSTASHLSFSRINSAGGAGEGAGKVPPRRHLSRPLPRV